MRRYEDYPIVKLVKLWPVVLTLVGVITGYVLLQRDVKDSKDQLVVHEKRISRVEVNAAVARINTDAIVQKILSPNEQRQLQSQVDTVSTYLLKAGEAEGGSK